MFLNIHHHWQMADTRFLLFDPKILPPPPLSFNKMILVVWRKLHYKEMFLMTSRVHHVKPSSAQLDTPSCWFVPSGLAAASVSTSLPNPSVGSEASENMSRDGKKACKTLSRLFWVIRTNSQTWSGGKNLHRRGKYSTVLSRMGT